MDVTGDERSRRFVRGLLPQADAYLALFPIGLINYLRRDFEHQSRSNGVSADRAICAAIESFCCHVFMWLAVFSMCFASFLPIIHKSNTAKARRPQRSKWISPLEQFSLYSLRLRDEIAPVSQMSILLGRESVH